MAFEIYRDAQQKLIRVTFSRAATLEEILEADRLVLDDEMWDGWRRMLVIVQPGTDLSTLTLEQFLETALPYIEASFARRGATAREAWVVPDPINSPIVHLWDQLPNKDPFHTFAVFANEAAAVDWLSSTADLGSEAV